MNRKSMLLCGSLLFVGSLEKKIALLSGDLYINLNEIQKDHPNYPDMNTYPLQSNTVEFPYFWYGSDKYQFFFRDLSVVLGNDTIKIDKFPMNKMNDFLNGTIAHNGKIIVGNKVDCGLFAAYLFDTIVFNQKGGISLHTTTRPFDINNWSGAPRVLLLYDEKTNALKHFAIWIGVYDNEPICISKWGKNPLFVTNLQDMQKVYGQKVLEVTSFKKVESLQ